MKKGCAILSGILVVLIGVPGAVVFSKVNRDYGITSAPVISHAMFAQPNTGFRLTIEPEHARDTIAALASPEFEMPSWSPVDFETALDQVVPREIALLTTPDYDAGKLHFTIFMNERRLGPQLVSAINQGKSLEHYPKVQWDDAGFNMPERGVITASGSVDLPDGFEGELLRYWSPRKRPVILSTEGGHLLEAVLDNRHGDAFMLWATVMSMSGRDWRRTLQTDQFQAVMSMLVYVDDIHMTADLADPDTLKVAVTINADPEVGANLAMILNVGVPGIQLSAKRLYQCEFQGEFVWDETEEVIRGDFAVTGIRAELERQRDRIVAASR